MPSHRRTNNSFQQPREQSPRRLQGSSVLGDNTRDVDEGRAERDRGIYADVEEWMILCARPVERRRSDGGLAEVMTMRDVWCHGYTVQRYLVLRCGVGPEVYTSIRGGHAAVGISPDLQDVNRELYPETLTLRTLIQSFSDTPRTWLRMMRKNRITQVQYDLTASLISAQHLHPQYTHDAFR